MKFLKIKSLVKKEKIQHRRSRAAAPGKGAWRRLTFENMLITLLPCLPKSSWGKRVRLIATGTPSATPSAMEKAEMDEKETANATFQSRAEFFSVSAIGGKLIGWYRFCFSRLGGPECSVNRHAASLGIRWSENCLELKRAGKKGGGSPCFSARLVTDCLQNCP